MPLTVESSEARALITEAMMSGRISIFSILRNMSPGKASRATVSAEYWPSFAWRMVMPTTKPMATARMVETRSTFSSIDRLNSCMKVKFFVYRFSLLMELLDELVDLFLAVSFIDSLGWLPPGIPIPVAPPPPPVGPEELWSILRLVGVD